MARNFHRDPKIRSTIAIGTVSAGKEGIYIDYKLMLFSGLRERSKKNEILIKMYLIARNTLPTFCGLLNERHASALSQKLFLKKYLSVSI
uniref:Uncharacterized protein n=1 Tax=uncultured Verrucomicrobiales bacterium HF0010_05E02 TaxID=710995 RepID=E0XQN6_9BACT|nr:hypothetical protein [uncultured Verrucomicrobiales bacterium HF0010_05E02]